LVATALLDKETIDGAEVAALVQQGIGDAPGVPVRTAD
jgi:hypothetical protein